jgi:ribose 1,5-bisphosphokinase
MDRATMNGAASLSARLIYVAGPSGAGKDSLIDYARSRLHRDSSITFARRFITRPRHAGSENHVALDEAAFEAARRAGRFALCWESNGRRYGIGVEIDALLARGVDVVVNGSRAYLAGALARYPGMTVVWVSAPEALLAKRLLTRGRESDEEIAVRLSRLAGMRPPSNVPVIEISNAAGLEVAGEQFVALLLAGAGEPRLQHAAGSGT